MINAVYSYLEKNGIINNPTVLHLMIGHSSMDLSSILDFFNWLKEQDESFNIYKMPEIIFNDIIGKYESSREKKLNNKTKKDIMKCFNNKSSEQIYMWISKVFGNKKVRGLSYIFERYYNDKAKYKCIILPLKGETDLKKFLQEYWYDLDAASSDLLDIFYGLKELNNTGVAILEKIKDMEIDIKKLPCIIIWQHDISTARAISIRKLSHSDLCSLLLGIISCIEKDMDMEQIYKEATKMTEKYNETKPDLVMMDITMPEMDGIQALKKIKEADANATVIMCSAMGQQAMVIESIQSGAKDFIVKPFQADRVLEAVKKAIG